MDLRSIAILERGASSRSAGHLQPLVGNDEVPKLDQWSDENRCAPPR
ncbi:hypothetical protein LZC95_04660 [Pendulispora brunnea]|uniref:Uncharacterized protein n=1 Tax=Pendulispora brunnea TaxID=2905690 RepID=A0ABZ2KGS2_9BACT